MHQSQLPSKRISDLQDPTAWVRGIVDLACCQYSTHSDVKAMVEYPINLPNPTRCLRASMWMIHHPGRSHILHLGPNVSHIEFSFVGIYNQGFVDKLSVNFDRAGNNGECIGKDLSRASKGLTIQCVSSGAYAHLSFIPTKEAREFLVQELVRTLTA